MCKKIIITRIIFPLVLLISGYNIAQAENLKNVYLIAKEQDPTVQAAYAQLKANKQRLPQAIAQLLPRLSGNYATTGNDTSIPGLLKYNSRNYNLTLSQPIYRPELWAQLEQSRHIGKGAYATYLSAQQNLIIRVAERYFAILGAEDDLNFSISQRKAFARQLEQTQQRFEVGLIPITDVHEAQARHDGAVAREVGARNTVADEYEKLREITGVQIQNIDKFPTSKPLPLLPPSPNQQETWVNTAYNHNLDVIAAKENALQFKSAIGTQAAGHFPKVDVSAKVDRNKPTENLFFSKSVTLNMSVPIFESGGTIFRTKEARGFYEEADKKLETQQRAAVSNTRQAFRGVLTKISEVEAIKQAVVSNNSALKATRAAYEVGTRTIVDVLDAETNLLSAQREHAKSRYNYLFEGLRLKQAAGVLLQEDLFAVNDLMVGVSK